MSIERIPERITEEMHLEKKWFSEASKQTPATLMDFIDHVMNDYIHDYGTIVHAISACAIAAAWAANNSEGAQGGITGFQAGFVMWDFIREWRYPNNECGLRIIDFDNMLYPQYECQFEKTITPDTWNRIRNRAKRKLEESNGASDYVINHWGSIKRGKIPFGYKIREE